MKPGKSGQVAGAVRVASDPDAACSIIAAMCGDMAQWWAPLRRQQAGSVGSSLLSSVAVSGPSPKNRIRKMEKPRRM
jgi:hypothetical protein